MNTKTKKPTHTPGPWNASDPLDGAVSIHAESQQSKHAIWIGEAITSQVTDEEAQANGQLFAAAPNMFEACRRIANTDVASMGAERFAAWAKNMAFNAIQKAQR